MTDTPADHRATWPEVTYAVGGAGVAWRETAGEIVVLDVAGSVYFGLNGAAALLWKQLLDGASRDALTAVLMSTAPVGRDVAEADVDGFLVELDRYALLRRT